MSLYSLAPRAVSWWDTHSLEKPKNGAASGLRRLASSGLCPENPAEPRFATQSTDVSKVFRLRPPQLVVASDNTG